MIFPDGQPRCSWVNPNNEKYIYYHDHEWGIPVHDDRKLFEMLTLEIFQAGLSWECILNKREAFRAAFDDFDYHRISAFGADKIDSLMQDPGIIRCRGKIEAAVQNAAAFENICTEKGSFDAFLWSWTDGKTVFEQGRDRSLLSDAVSADLKARGMKRLGSKTVYAYLQAVGVIYGHDKKCFLFRKTPEK